VHETPLFWALIINAGYSRYKNKSTSRIKKIVKINYDYVLKWHRQLVIVIRDDKIVNWKTWCYIPSWNIFETKFQFTLMTGWEKIEANIKVMAVIGPPGRNEISCPTNIIDYNKLIQFSGTVQNKSEYQWVNENDYYCYLITIILIIYSIIDSWNMIICTYVCDVIFFQISRKYCCIDGGVISRCRFRWIVYRN